MQTVEEVGGIKIVQDAAYRYADDVLNGRIPACRKIKKACRRHMFDLSRVGRPDFPYVYDPELAARPVEFARHLKHWEGKEFAGKPFECLPWQAFLLGCIFGWVHRDTGYRRYRYAYVEIPRKNGKSFLAAAVGLYMMCADGEAGAQVYSVATKREQAKIVWNNAVKVAEASPLAEYVREYWVGLAFDSTNSRFEPLASNSKKLDGLNPHCAVCDELHKWENRELWDVIEDAFGARTQPLMFVITTAGEDQTSICFEQRTHGVSILDGFESGNYVDDTYFVFIADVNEEDIDANWMEERVWAEANPSYGSAKNREYMIDQINKAKLMPSKLAAVKNKQLNIWTQVSRIWLNMDRWDKCAGPIDRKKLYRAKCYAGLDLSSIYDITANVLVFNEGPYEEVTILPFFYLPEGNLAERVARDKAPLDRWVEEGHIRLTPGDIVDLDFIYKDMLALKDEFNISSVGFDPWKAVEIATRLQNEGLEMVQMRQGHGTLGAPTLDLEKRVMSKTIRHGGNPVLRWMASNTVVIKDTNDNIRPDKAKSHKRIDGIVATIMGLGRRMVDVKPASRYDSERGLRSC